MNIIAVDKCPKKSAQWLRERDPRRANKMIVETAQILSYALWRNVPEMAADLHKVGKCYNKNPFYANNRFVKWAAESSGNYLWLLEYALESLRLFGKPHKCKKIIYGLTNCFVVRNDLIFNKVLGTDFVHYAQAKSKPEFSVPPEKCSDVHSAYKMYITFQLLNELWRKLAWKQSNLLLSE